MADHPVVRQAGIAFGSPHRHDSRLVHHLLTAAPRAVDGKHLDLKCTAAIRPPGTCKCISVHFLARPWRCSIEYRRVA